MTRRRLCLGCLFTTLACLRSKALSFNPFDKALTSVVKRPQFESLVSERFGKQTRVEFVPDDTSPGKISQYNLVVKHNSAQNVFGTPDSGNAG